MKRIVTIEIDLQPGNVYDAEIARMEPFDALQYGTVVYDSLTNPGDDGNDTGGED